MADNSSTPYKANAPQPRTERPVAIIGGNRIPFARQDRAYAKVSNQEMFTAALDGLVSRFNLQGEQLGICLLYTSPSPRDATLSRMPSSA